MVEAIATSIDMAEGITEGQHPLNVKKQEMILVNEESNVDDCDCEYWMTKESDECQFAIVNNDFGSSVRLYDYDKKHCTVKSSLTYNIQET